MCFSLMGASKGASSLLEIFRAPQHKLTFMGLAINVISCSVIKINGKANINFTIEGI